MPILRLAHDGPRDVVFAVPEDRVALVRALLGRREAVQVRLWGQVDLLPATIREVAAAADPATRTFAVKADIPGRMVLDRLASPPGLATRHQVENAAGFASGFFLASGGLPGQA